MAVESLTYRFFGGTVGRPIDDSDFLGAAAFGYEEGEIVRGTLTLTDDALARVRDAIAASGFPARTGLDVGQPGFDFFFEQPRVNGWDEGDIADRPGQDEVQITLTGEADPLARLDFFAFDEDDAPDGPNGFFSANRVRFTDDDDAVADVLGLWLPETITPQVVEGTGGGETLRGTDARYNFVSGLGGDDRILIKDGVGYGFGGQGDDYIKGHDQGDVLAGGPGEDKILGRGGDDAILGGRGNDELRGERGSDTIEGEFGDDILKGGSGDDALHGGEGDDRLEGNDGVDILHAGNGQDYLKGGSGDDILDADGSSDGDRMFGNGGSDLLLAGSGDDILNGGSGDDRIIGGLGSNAIDTGPGQDTVVFLSGNGGRDTITGFQFGQDHVELVDAEVHDIHSFEDLLATARVVGNDTVFELSILPGIGVIESLTFVNRSVGDFSQADFLFS